MTDLKSAQKNIKNVLFPDAFFFSRMNKGKLHCVVVIAGTWSFISYENVVPVGESSQMSSITSAMHLDYLYFRGRRA